MVYLEGGEEKVEWMRSYELEVPSLLEHLVQG